MLRFPSSFTPQSFLEQHWQKKPLFMPDALPDVDPLIAADDLAWLATQPDVEARLVVTETARHGTRYRVQHGPFTARRLRRLPAEHWTLLVHDVEKHLPEFRSYYAAVSFVPDWRIDDLMITVAAPGGSVGPHRDQYDVFLCHASGRRRWHLATPEEAVPGRHRGGLALLEPFESPAPITAGPSDVLYLPPVVPHWGIALDMCVTCSLGMRAPTRNELADVLRLVLAEESRGVPPHAGDEPDLFYTDPDLRPDEAQPGMISPRTLERAAGLVTRQLRGRTANELLLARAVGALVTAPKEFLAPELPEEDEIATLARRVLRSERTPVHGMARLAWCAPHAAPPMVFVNGRERTVSPETLDEFRHLCGERTLAGTCCAEWTKNDPSNDFLRWLIASGSFDLVDAEL